MPAKGRRILGPRIVKKVPLREIFLGRQVGGGRVLHESVDHKTGTWTLRTRNTTDTEGECVMVSVGQEDVLRGLKKFRRLAKQDLLASEHTSDPEFWREQAHARRDTYARLIESVEQRGVDAAYREAIEAYAALPLLRDGQKDANISGGEQAYEMFFRLVGIDDKEITRLRNGRRRRPFRESAREIEVATR